MSETTPDLTKQTASANAVPTWIASGVLGLAVGAGAMYLGLQFVSPAKPAGNAAATKEAAGDPMSRVQVVGGGGGMGGGGMGGGGMGGGGGGGGGKRNLTALVGKLELLSNPEVKLHVEMDADQAKKVAAKLAELDKAETMTAEGAQAELEALEALLTPEQKTTLALVSLPFGRPGGGGGGLGAAGRPGAGGPPAAAGAPPGGGGPPMGGGGGGAPDENPFAQEANQKKLRDLLGRLAPDSAAAPAEKPAESEAEKPAAAKVAD